MTDRDDDLINLLGVPTSLASSRGREFVCDCTRAAENLLSDQDLRDKYQLSDWDWQTITGNTALIRAIQAERRRRVNTGLCAREAAAQHFVKAPKILHDLMTNEQANPRHKIEAIRELRATATGAAGAEHTIDTSEKFIIRIDLGGADTEIFEKVITPTKPLLATNKDEVIDDND
jgi:hypothetical protein